MGKPPPGVAYRGLPGSGPCDRTPLLSIYRPPPKCTLNSDAMRPPVHPIRHDWSDQRIPWESESGPTTVVGTGTPASCTGDEFVAAVANGGIITFDCRP